MIKHRGLIIFAIFFYILSAVCPVFAINDYNKAENAGIDLCIKKVWFSNMNFQKGDFVQLYALVENKGTDSVKNDAAYFGVKNMTGCLSKNLTDYDSKSCQTNIAGNGGTRILALTSIEILSDEVSFDVSVDLADASDLNTEDNSKHIEFKTQKDQVDLEVENITITPTDFKAGDNVKVYADIFNRGGAFMEYQTLDIICSVGENKSEPIKRATALKSGERQNVYAGEFKADSDSADVTVTVSKANNESLTENNTCSAFKRSYVQEDGYIWDKVAITNGGNEPTGAVNVKDGIIYMGTDVGGMYALNKKLGAFYDMTMKMPDDVAGVVPGIAPINGNKDIVYVMLSKESLDTRGFKDYSDVYRTLDGGKTWKEMNFPGRLPNYGLIDLPIAADANNPDYVYVTTYFSGAWVCKNAMSNTPVWENITPKDVKFSPYIDLDLDLNKNDIMGAVVIDEKELYKGRSKNVYMSSYAKGIYKSSNGGDEFSLMEGSPKGCISLKLSNDGLLYAICRGDKNNELWVFDGNQWELIYETDQLLYKVAISPVNSNNIAISQEFDVLVSTNKGKSFRSMGRSSETIAATPVYGKKNGFDHVGMLVFDPTEENMLWNGDWYGTYCSEDITAGKIQRHEVQKNVEEFCMLTVKSVRGKDALLTGSMDNSGHIALPNFFDNQTGRRLKVDKITNCTSIDYCRADPNFIVAFGGGRWCLGNGDGAYTTDGGETMIQFGDSLPKNANGERAFFGNAAVSSGYNKNGVPTILGAANGDGIYRTENLGKTWEKISINTTPSFSWGNNIQLACDPNKNGVFYFYSAINGVFYRSDDDGKTFKEVSKLPIAYPASLRVMENNEGCIALGLQGSGLWLSKDGGESFEKAAQIDSCNLVGTGMKYDGAEYDTIFVAGNIGDKYAIYKSIDFGKSWTKLTNENYNMYSILTGIDGDQNRKGVVYLATTGNGCFVGMPKDGDFKKRNIVADIPDGTIQREKNFNVTGATDADGIVTISVNGRTYTTERDPYMNFSKNVELDEGENEIVVSVGDGDKKISTSGKVICSSDYLNISLNDNDIKLRKELKK